MRVRYLVISARLVCARLEGTGSKKLLTRELSVLRCFQVASLEHCSQVSEAAIRVLLAQKVVYECRREDRATQAD